MPVGGSINFLWILLSASQCQPLVVVACAPQAQRLPLVHRLYHLNQRQPFVVVVEAPLSNPWIELDSCAQQTHADVAVVEVPLDLHVLAQHQLQILLALVVQLQAVDPPCLEATIVWVGSCSLVSRKLYPPETSQESLVLEASGHHWMALLLTLDDLFRRGALLSDRDLLHDLVEKLRATRADLHYDHAQIYFFFLGCLCLDLQTHLSGCRCGFRYLLYDFPVLLPGSRCHQHAVEDAGIAG